MKIFVEMDEDFRFRIMADCGRMSPAPAGPRIFRGPPHPEVAFVHDSPDAAEEDARKIRVYLTGLPKKPASKKKTYENHA